MMQVPVTISPADRARLNKIIDAKNKAADVLADDIVNTNQTFALTADVKDEQIRILFGINELKWHKFKNLALLEISTVERIARQDYLNSSTKTNLNKLAVALKKQLEVIESKRTMNIAWDDLC